MCAYVPLTVLPTQDFLLFHMKDGRLELLGTDFCKRIDRKIFAYLTTCHSIPAFLSSCTLDLFERQTFAS